MPNNISIQSILEAKKILDEQNVPQIGRQIWTTAGDFILMAIREGLMEEESMRKFVRLLALGEYAKAKEIAPATIFGLTIFIDEIENATQ